MENEINEIPEQEEVLKIEPEEEIPDEPKKKFGWIKPGWLKRKVTLIIIGVLALGAAVFYFKGLVVAATVNGRIISRLALIGELEKTGGKQALESLITEAIIKDEIKKNNIQVSREDVNGELENIKASLAAQGGTLAAALTAQGMTEEELKGKIEIQKQVEKLLEGRITVTDAEIESFIKENQGAFPAEMAPDEMRDQVRQELRQNKFNQEAQNWLRDLKAKAKINYFVNY